MKISFGPNRFTTRTVKRTLNPQWNEQFKLSVLDWNEDGTVVNLQVGFKDASKVGLERGRHGGQPAGELGKLEDT